MKKIFLIVSTTCALMGIALFAFAEIKTYRNLGFLEGNIWYSKDPFFAGDKVRIYSAVYNSSANDLVGAIEFFDNAVLLGTMPFSVQGVGRMKDVWVDWIPTKGDHKISARIINAKLSIIGGAEEAITLASSQSGASERFADSDTDRDGVGDREDADDDNDTISDVEEIKRGTNQYQKDSDKDGIMDDKEVAALNGAPNDTKNNTTPSAPAENLTVATVRAAVVVARDAIDRVADTASKKVAVFRDETATSLAPQDKSPRPNTVFQKPLEYGYFLALSLAAFILQNKIALYAILALVVFWLSRSIFRRLFSR